MKQKLNTIQGCIDTFEELEAFDIYEWLKQLNLPTCDYCVRIAHRVRSQCMSVKLYMERKEPLKGLAQREVESLQAKLTTLALTDIIFIDKELTRLDRLFDTTH